MPKDRTALAPIIRNMGLHWKREKVNWSKVDGKVQLLGKYRRTVVNFHDQIGIYVLYKDFVPVYVGLCGIGQDTIGNRLLSHTKGKHADRWDGFSWFGLRFVKNNLELSTPPKGRGTDTSTILHNIEGILLDTIDPQLNRKGGTWGKDVIKYKQQVKAK